MAQNEDELIEKIEEWLEMHSEVFNEIKEDWLQNSVVKPVENPQQKFKCNHCGNCCKFSPEIFPQDIICWLEEKRYEIICSIFPFYDENENITMGFPTQDDFSMRMEEIFKDPNISNEEKNAFKRISDAIRNLNPGFSQSSEYCIFYNPDQEKHCLIYETRPYSCQVYPYELPNFVKIEIPESLSNKYAKTEINLLDSKIGSGKENKQPQSPDISNSTPSNFEILCSADCFSKKNPFLPTECSDDDILAVVIDRANYLETTLFPSDDILDILSSFIELFWSKIKVKHKSQVKKNAQKRINKKSNSKKSTKKFSKSKNKNQLKKNYKIEKNKKSVKMTFGPFIPDNNEEKE
ncbi:MAG: YkgJ family cysteine cluster protein [Promethearchaeota archaeon]